MTKLTKPITRSAQLLRGEVAITMDPAGMLWFREKGRRRRFPVDLNLIFARAVAAQVAAERKLRRRGSRS